MIKNLLIDADLQFLIQNFKRESFDFKSDLQEVNQEVF